MARVLQWALASGALLAPWLAQEWVAEWGRALGGLSEREWVAA